MTRKTGPNQEPPLIAPIEESRVVRNANNTANIELIGDGVALYSSRVGNTGKIRQLFAFATGEVTVGYNTDAPDGFGTADAAKLVKQMRDAAADGTISRTERAALDYSFDDIRDDHKLNGSAPNKPDGYGR